MNKPSYFNVNLSINEESGVSLDFFVSTPDGIVEKHYEQMEETKPEPQYKSEAKIRNLISEILEEDEEARSLSSMSEDELKCEIERSEAMLKHIENEENLVKKSLDEEPDHAPNSTPSKQTELPSYKYSVKITRIGLFKKQLLEGIICGSQNIYSLRLAKRLVKRKNMPISLYFTQYESARSCQEFINRLGNSRAIITKI